MSTKNPLIIGLDVGTKTIGVAISDGLGLCAHRVTTISRKGVKTDTVKIQRIIDERGAEKVIVGLPYELDGSESRSARLARQIGEAVHISSELEVLYIDERYSSVAAEQQLISVDMSRSKRKKVIDQQAAVVILQSYLDHGEF
jgi:putative Holliday junction resolvase